MMTDSTDVEDASSILRAVTEAWPPTERGDARGYRRIRLTDLRPIDALGLPSQAGARLAVVVAAGPAERLAALPLVQDGPGWRVAAGGDGAAEALLAALRGRSRRAARFRLERSWVIAGATGERSVGVDQTNRSIVVGEALVVKWYTHPGVDGMRAATLLAHLAEVGFGGVPRLHGTLAWEPRDGLPPAILAIVDEHHPGARDGWEWCVEAVIDHLAQAHRCASDCPAVVFPDELGGLTAGLHMALASPSSRIPAPVGTAAGEAVAAWHSAALAELEAALAVDAPDAHLVAERRARLRADLGRLREPGPVAVQLVHGDLHVGQVLRGPAGLRIIDLDGPPGEASAGVERWPAARDLAHLLLSLELVAEVARRRVRPQGRSDALARWTGAARADLLRAYRDGLAGRPRRVTHDERLIGPFMAWQLCRELRYAADTLPRWRYAPMGALARLYPAAGS